MTTSIHAFMRPHRPVAVRAFNYAGGLLQKSRLLRLPLDAAALIAAARQKTGLDNFGDDHFREPLRRLVDSLNRESRLNTVGRIAAQREVLQLLINRLQIERDRNENPRIAEQKIKRPIFIVGMPRTGTSLLHALLALDPALRAPLTWEVMFPSPASPKEDLRKIKAAEKALVWLNRLAPDFKAIHPVDARLPQECVAIMSHLFMSDQFDVMFHLPAFRTWLEEQEMRPAYEFHRRFLQHLQQGCPARRWILKAPGHMLYLDALLAVYPDALIVQTHREPLDVMASVASLTTVLRSVFSDHSDPALIGRELAPFWSGALDRFASVRERHPAAQFLDVHFSGLLCDPLLEVDRLYGWSGMELAPEAKNRMRDFLTANPRDKHGRHRYAPGQFAIDPRADSPLFTAYRARFHLPEPAV